MSKKIPTSQDQLPTEASIAERPMETSVDVKPMAPGMINKADDGSYTMSRNVKFNDIVYHKGDRVSATDACAELFLKEGYMQ